MIKKSKRFQDVNTYINQNNIDSDTIMSRRMKLVMIFIVLLGLIFIVRLFITQVSQKDFYQSKLNQYNTNTIQFDATRGEITDRNYQSIVYNQNKIGATYYAVKNINKVQIQTISNFMVKNITVDISNVTLRDKKDYLILKDPDFCKSLVSNSEIEKIKNDDQYNKKLYNLQIDAITEDIINSKLTEDDIKYYMIYSKINSCKSGSVLLLDNLSVEDASSIGANSSLLKGVRVTNDWERAYSENTLLKQTMGKLTTKKQGLPKSSKDVLSALDYSNDSRVGTSGIEKQYENILKGVGSTYTLSYGSDGSPLLNKKYEGRSGSNIQLTIDLELQKKITEYVDNELLSHRNEPFNNHIYCILQDPKNGDILAMVGREINQKTGEISDYSAGNYLSAYKIGSSMKAAVIYTCFKNNVIKANHYETDTSEGIKIKGTPVKRSWNKVGFGNINEVTALAYSSNIYMMKIIIKLAGGNYQYDKALKLNKDGFTKLRNGAGELGLGVKTGIDVDKEALGYRGNSENSGNLLDFSIGQYDTYTNMQLSTYATTLANKGIRVKPHLFKSSYTINEDGQIKTLDTFKKTIVDDVSEHKDAFDQIQKGMKAVVDYGTVSSSFVNFPYKVAAKTGTAEDYTNSGNVDYPNHMLIGYASVDNPSIVASVIVERQKNNNSAPGVFKYALSCYYEKYGYKD